MCAVAAATAAATAGRRGFISLLEDVDSAQVALLDRWQVGFTDARVPRSLTDARSRGGGVKGGGAGVVGGGSAAGSASSGSRPARSVIMQNYVGVGVDAKVALEWHQRRQSAPQLFTSRLRNKMHYARHEDPTGGPGWLMAAATDCRLLLGCLCGSWPLPTAVD